MGLTKAQLEALNISSFPDNTSGLITPDILREYNSASIANTVNQDTYTTDSASFDSRINAITGSVTSAITASSLITASFDNGTRNLTFTKGNNTTFNVNIPDVSGSSGNFATTGSNVFVGNQTISGSLLISGSEVVTGPLTASSLQINGITDLNGVLDVSNDATFRGDVLIQSSGEQKFKMRSTSGGGVSQGFDLLIQTSSFIIRDETHDIDFLEFDYISSSGDHILKLEANRFEMNSGSLGVSGSFTASLQEGYVWAGGAGDVSTLVATSSFGGGGTINTGSFATTGSNTFKGDQIISGAQNHLITSLDNGIQLQFGASENGQGFDMRVTSSISSQQQTWFIENQGGVWGNAFFGRMYVDSPLVVNQTLTASLQEGYVWVGNSLGKTSTVATSSFGGGGALPAGVLSSSVTNFVDYSASVDTRINNIVSGTGFATTGSNTFTGNQTVSASILLTGNVEMNKDVNAGILYPMDGGKSVRIQKQVGINRLSWVDQDNDKLLYLDVDSGVFFVSGNFQAALQNGYAWVGQADGYSGQVPTSSFGGGGALPSGLLSSSVTNFVDYSASVDSRINAITGSGGSVNTGSFATTGSNTFNGDQSITGSVSVFLPKASGKQFRVDWGNAGSASMFTEESGGANQSLIIVSASIDLRRGGIDFTSGSIRNSGDQIQFNAAPSASFILRTQNGGTAEMTAFTDFTDLNRPYGQVRANFDGNLTLRGNGGSVTITGSTGTVIEGLTYPQTDGTAGQVLTTNGSKVLSFTTISGGGTAFANPNIESISGSLLLTANTFNSGSATVLHLSASAQNQANLVFKNNNSVGSTIISGSNNIFTNPGNPTTGRVNYIGGSSNLFLNGQSQQLPQITGSAASVSGNRPTMNANIIAGTQAWTINQAVNTGAHTYSNNIINGVGSAWTFNTTGNTGPVTVSNNLGLGSNMTLNSPSRSVAQINAGESGSNNLSITNNSIAGNLNYQGPVSSSFHSIQNNNIAGIVNLNVQSGSRGLTLSANIINGTLGFNDNTVFAPTLGSSNSINNNNINGVATFTLAGSSSFNALNNNLNTVTITSFLDASAVTNAFNRSAALNGNAVFGSNNSILFSGSQGAAPTGRTLGSNLIAGQFISASLIGDGSGSNMFGTAILGGGLNVIGTTTIPAAGIQQNYGSAFFGRWNATDGNRASTAQTILAVGTGTSGSAGIVRKTGFLIDSGSNSFFEGTLNVSGAVSFTGSAPSILSSSFSGSLITNLTDIYTDIPAVQQIVTLTSASYAALASGSLTDPNTLYIVSGSTQIDTSIFATTASFNEYTQSNDQKVNSLIQATGSFATTGSNNFVGNQSITGSLILSSSAAVELTVIGNSVFTGSARANVIPLSITSNTASMDLSLGNYFTLTLADTTTTHISASNVQPGQSATLVITTGTNSSASLAPTMLQPSGSAYSATLGSSKLDVLSIVSVANGVPFVVSTKNMV